MRLRIAAALLAALPALASAAAAGDQGDDLRRQQAESARRAAEILAERQQGPGYWVTAYTGEARFEKPTDELNTFTTALLIDIVDPVAAGAGINGLVDRARAFLAGQIESDGLVRYHGRADLRPGREIWRCIITPDADDTSLVWRIAPGANRELLSQALAKMGEFRAANGLYRTWLAPQARYECVDPGSDPNPTDIAIQMHVLMLLAQVDPPAAVELCRALSKASSDDKLWVYYGIAPLVPMLRLSDLRKVDCVLQLPPARSQTAVPGQDLWLEVVRLVDRMERAQAGPADYSRADDVLQRLAADRFSPIRTNPPLLYHNDFTAHVKRFYWSEDVGYALWLRLHSDRERGPSGRAQPRGHR